MRFSAFFCQPPLKLWQKNQLIQLIQFEPYVVHFKEFIHKRV